MPGLPQSILTLSKPVSTQGLVALRAAAIAALERGETRIALDVDDAGTLDSAVIATLVTILRDVRERGATVELRASRQRILDTLRITALDQVFTVVAHEGAPAPVVVRVPVPRSHVKSRRIAAFVAALLACAFAGPRSSSAAAPSAADVVRAVVEHDAALASYRAAVGVDLHLRSFPYVSQHLDGTTYYKRPDNFEVVFRNVPSYAKGFDKIYGDIDDPTSWERRFTLSLAGERVVDGHRDVVVRLVQKVRGMIDHEDVAIDPGTWHIDRMSWFYYNGGTIDMSQEYQNVAGFALLARQHATIHIPFVHAAADAVYRDYETNVAIDDAVFSKEKK